MSTARTALLCALAFAAGVLTHRAFTPIRPFDVHISGDGAAQIAAEVFTLPGPERARDPDHAAMQVIAFRRWQNVESMTGLMATCGAACDGTIPVVVLRRPSLDGLTKVLFIDLGAHGAGPALDAGEPMNETLVLCLTGLIQRHLHDLSANVTKCDLQEETEALRPRLRTPGGEFLRGL